MEWSLVELKVYQLTGKTKTLGQRDEPDLQADPRRSRCMHPGGYQPFHQELSTPCGKFLLSLSTNSRSRPLPYWTERYIHTQRRNTPLKLKKICYTCTPCAYCGLPG